MQATGSDGSPANDIVKALEQDHMRILQFFTEFRELRAAGSIEDKQTLVEMACTELVIHAELEEALLYPALQEKHGRLDCLDEAQAEHAVAKQLVLELEAMEAGDELYDAKFVVLGEYVEHHISEERQQIFPLLQNFGTGLEIIRSRLLRRRNDLRSEFGIPEEDYEEEDERKSQQPASPADRRKSPR